MAKTRYFIVTKGEPMLPVFGQFYAHPYDKALVNGVEKNLAGFPAGTKLGCVVREFGFPVDNVFYDGDVAIASYGKGYRVDYKLVRDFGPMDMIRFFGLKKGLSLMLMEENAR